jgi:RNA polymerase sigma-70 factor (ECF subfamily)
MVRRVTPCAPGLEASVALPSRHEPCPRVRSIRNRQSPFRGRFYERRTTNHDQPTTTNQQNLNPFHRLPAPLLASMLVGDEPAARVNSSPQVDPRPDHQLVAAVNAGDAAAFDCLYYRHRDWAAALAFRFTRDRDTALDVLQETFLYFARKFPGFKLTCQLRSFLYPVVKNLAISALRKADRLTSLDALLENDGMPEPAAETPSTASDDELASALSGLSAEHREVLRLRFVEGFDLRELADALEIPLGTVKSRLHHAVNQLRQSPRARKFFKD